MNHGQIFGLCHSRGVVLEPHGETLRYRAPRGVLDLELMQALRDHKSELIGLLTNGAAYLANACVCPVPSGPTGCARCEICELPLICPTCEKCRGCKLRLRYPSG